MTLWSPAWAKCDQLEPPKLGNICQLKLRKTSLMNLWHNMGRFLTLFILNTLLLRESSFPRATCMGERVLYSLLLKGLL